MIPAWCVAYYSPSLLPPSPLLPPSFASLPPLPPLPQIDYIFIGTTIQETKTSNIAREAALGAGIPLTVPAHTVTQACISSNQAITSACEKILSGQAHIALVGGVDTLSDPPIKFSKPIRERLLQAQKVMKKGTMATLGLLKGLHLKDFAPESPSIANYTTGEVMGHSSDRLSERFGITRYDQDEFTVRSHHLAAKAHEDGSYLDEIIPIDGSSRAENGIKSETNIEKVSKLKPVFRPNGTHTAANSSYLTDGATAALIMSEEKALEYGYKPLAYIRDWIYIGADPYEEMLLGPTYATKLLLDKNSLSLNDIDVYEIHEAFAGQVLSNLIAMNSEKFAEKNFENKKKVGKIPIEKINTRGGSLAIGHPFGATGVRIMTTAARRLQYENKKYGLLTACADGGLAHAALIERYE
jgi:acetyl-CoA acyltransferase